MNKIISWGAYHVETESTIHVEDVFRIAVPWGSFGPNGEWHPNPALKISADEQYRQNVKNGFLPRMLE
jgi:hypothetical protein